MAVDVDIGPRADDAYRIVVWTVGAAFDRKYPKLEALDANVIVAPRSANESRLLRANRTTHTSMVWVGRHVQRGLGALAFGDSRIKLDGRRWDQRLEWVAPTRVSGAVNHNLLAIWALNERARVTFRTNPQRAQAIEMMRLYRSLLTTTTVVAGNFDDNPVFHRNDPNWDFLEFVARAETAGLRSAYHAYTELEHGDPREQPTRFRPDPGHPHVGHHVDYCFVPTEWLPALRSVRVGEQSVWAPTVRGEVHVPLVVDFDLSEVRSFTVARRQAR
ncbi:MAG: hypothetical protein ACR2P0_00325 [Acidimicrobiales bacterium]